MLSLLSPCCQITIQKVKVFEQIVQHLHMQMHNCVIVYTSSCFLIFHFFSFFCDTQTSYMSLLAAVFLYHENEWYLGISQVLVSGYQSNSKNLKYYTKYHEVFAGNTSF